MKVLVTDGVAKEGIAYLEEQGCEVKDVTGASEEELIAEIPGWDALIIRSATTVTPAIIDAATDLKVIGRAGIGTDNIDKDYAKEKGIVVVNAPHSNGISACEQAFALMLACARHTPQANASMHDHKWEKSKFKGVELYQKTLAIFGLGNIGKELAKRAQAFEMKVIAYDPFVSAEAGAKLGVTMIDTIDETLAQADFISVHMPKTPETICMFGPHEFDMMKKGVILINDARGGIFQEEALVANLENGKVYAVGLDVYEEEPCTDAPFFAFDNVILTPHLGASTAEAQTRASTQIAEYVVNGLRTGEYPTQVNK